MNLAEYINEIPLVDVHTHIDFRRPAAYPESTESLERIIEGEH